MVNYFLPVVEGRLLVLASGGVFGRQHDKNEKAWSLGKLSIFFYLFIDIRERGRKGDG